METLREVCREAASWTTPLQIGIDLSPMQFRYGDLASLVRAILLETGLAPGRLELEITEGVPINDLPRALSILRLLSCSASRSPWMISAPAVRRCRCCNRFPSTRSR